MNRVRTAVRLVAAARCGWGATCLVRPDRVVVAAGGAPDRPGLWFARVLGARELTQGLATLAAPDRRVLTAEIVVDGLHALSVLALAGVDASRRRPALLNAAAATGWALLGFASTRQPSSRYPGPTPSR